MRIASLFMLLLLVGCTKAPMKNPSEISMGSDWSRFLGPNGDSTSPETGILTNWPKDGLKVVWEAKMGMGYAPPVISKGKLFHFDRFGNSNRLTCRNATDGKLLWKFEYVTDYEDRYGYSPGPRACPVVDGERVFIYGAEGTLYALSTADGKELWKSDTQREYNFHQNFFGVGSVPIVEGDLLIVAIGGSPKGPEPNDLRDAKGNGTGLVAFDKATGKIVYKISDELASYSSPVTATIDGRRWGFYFARGGLVGFEPKSGKIDFTFPWRAKILESVNASNPVIIGNKVLITECYGLGAALIEVKPGGYKKLWTDAEKDRDEKSLACHWNTPIHVDGYVYGSSGRHENEATLRCVKLDDGEVIWSERGLERSSLTKIDNHFLCMTERGTLMLLKINPKKFDVVAKWTTDLDFPCWAAPVVANGYLYIRGKDRLLCCELIPH